MNTAVINIKTDPKIKKQAQVIADELGLSLSTLVNTYLRQFVRTQKVELTLNEEPSDYLIKSLKQSKEDIKNGRVTSFKNPEEMFSYLDKLIKDDKKSTKN